MKITVIGTGYVGLVSGVCYAELGHNVTCVDTDPDKIAILQNGGIPIYEPGLQELSQKNSREGRLRYTTDLTCGFDDAELVIIAVGTPPLPSGEADMQYIEAVAWELGKHLNGYKIICIKSTVPVGTNERIREMIRKHYAGPFDSASLPEFLREGTAVSDTLNPDRVIIGTNSERAAFELIELHSPLTENIMVTDIRSAEMIKYASNAFLATKISFINEIANICEKVGADVQEVAGGMGLDSRIGPAFLKAGIGYGGSCFPKDTKALIQIAGNVEYEFKLLKSVVEVNQSQRYSIVRKLEDALGSNMRGVAVGIWGLAFKPETDDVRESPAFEIITELVGRGVKIFAYDPIATENFRHMLNHPSITWCKTAMEAVRGMDALCLLTDWKEFSSIEPVILAAALKRPVLIDGRNVYQTYEIERSGLNYYPVGRRAIRRQDEFVRENC